MSLMRHFLNPWLRTVEKPRLRRGTPAQVRRALALQSRWLFYGPSGATGSWGQYGQIPCLEIMPRGVQTGRILLFIHGGGFVFGSPETHRAMAAQLAQRIGARAVLPRYRLAPEAPFPAAPRDIRAAWDGLLASGVAPGDIVLGGDSAGGALAFGLISALCAEGAPRPGAVFGFSPLADLTCSGESFTSNAARDVLLPVESAARLCEAFLRDQPADDPSVSPLFGQFRGAPPAWITVGDTEILLDDARRLAARLRQDGSAVELVVERDLPHVWPLFHNTLPEARRTLDALALWIRRQQKWEA
jgi:acetyl esterase/lipase